MQDRQIDDTFQTQHGGCSETPSLKDNVVMTVKILGIALGIVLSSGYSISFVPNSERDSNEHAVPMFLRTTLS